MAERREQREALAPSTVHNIPETRLSQSVTFASRLAVKSGADPATLSEDDQTINHAEPNVPKLWPKRQPQGGNWQRKQFYYMTGASKRRKLSLPVVGLCSVVVFTVVAYFYLVVKMYQSPIDVNQQYASLQEQVQQDTVEKNPIMSMDAARLHALAPLENSDYRKYTIRVNTWRRNEQLVLSLDHYSQCPSVAQIQVVWCDSENEPPLEVFNHPSGIVVIERHEVDSLNERFHVLLPTPTLGILSMDDDVIRSCEAVDAGFFQWLRSPERMLGFDSRMHEVTPTGWKYGPLSYTNEVNSYSLTLTRFAFLHRDYLDLYMMALPSSIFNFVDENLNCEDIAMSFFVSSLTNGKPPLLAPLWAVRAQVKLFHESSISGKNGHMDIRDTCVDTFANILELKEGDKHALIPSALMRYQRGLTRYGAIPDHKTLPEGRVLPREEAMKQELRQWASRGKIASKLNDMVMKSQAQAQMAGLVEKTPEWQQRFWDTYGVNDEGKVVRIGPGANYIRREDGSIEKATEETSRNPSSDLSVEVL